MFLSTKLLGVRRLSLIIGISAGLYPLFTREEPFGPPAQTPGEPWTNLFINLSNLALEFALYFISAWLIVRIIAWIIEGFMKDRKHAN
jgi:hypothetical protein